jgi:polyhydroxyalkanoate synthase
MILSRKALRKTTHLGKLGLKRGFSRAVERTVLSFVNGLAYVVDGAAKPTMGNVAKELVFKKGKLELWRVKPIGVEEVEIGTHEIQVEMVPPHPVPILLIPPLMVRPYVYDLRPEHSMIRALRNAGLDVFVVDFGVPDHADEGLRLDDYVLDFIPACIDKALEAAKKPEITLSGYCMGGIFALLHVATFQDPRVRNIVTIGAPINFEKMGILTVAARLGIPVMDTILDRLGNIPGSWSSAGFRLLSGTKAITKYADLFANLYDEEYVRGFDAIDTWLSEMIPYPRDAFRQMVKDVVHGNKMLKNELVFRDKRADLSAVRVPLLAFAGKSDNIATPQSTEAILELVGSTDKTYREVPGGHIGVVAGSSAPRAVWQPMIDWLKEKNEARPSMMRLPQIV